MRIVEVDVRSGSGYEAMAELRNEFAKDMRARYPESNSNYGPETLPGGMFPPDGAFLVLFDGDRPVGCVGYRQLPQQFAFNAGMDSMLHSECCEGKSLFMSKDYRGGVRSVSLLRALARRASENGYVWMFGNTGSRQPESLRLLRGFEGFRSEEIPLYDPDNPLAAHAFKIDLHSALVRKMVRTIY